MGSISLFVQLKSIFHPLLNMTIKIYIKSSAAS